MGEQNNRAKRYFNVYELFLLIVSHILICLAFFISPLVGAESSILSTITSLIGVWGIIIISKGDYFAHYIYIVFSILYSILSISVGYYGEAIIYTFVMLPIHIYSVFVWKKNVANPVEKVVKIKTISKTHIIVSVIVAIILLVPFYYLLLFLNTVNPIFSTLSLTTSILAAYYMMQRVNFFPTLFAIDDFLLVILWGIQILIGNYQYIPTLIVCSCSFINDLYSAFCWFKRSIAKKRED